jgi:hypothetical protein
LRSCIIVNIEKVIATTFSTQFNTTFSIKIVLLRSTAEAGCVNFTPKVQRCTTEGEVTPKDKILVTKFEFGGRFGMSLEGDCHEVEVTPNLEL